MGFCMLSVAEATVSNSWSELDSLTAVKDEALRPVGAGSFFLDPLPVCGSKVCCGLCVASGTETV